MNLVYFMHMQRLLKLKKALKASLMPAYAEAYRAGKNSPKCRPLSPDEIQVLEKNGNHCDDWSSVTVAIGL